MPSALVSKVLARITRKQSSQNVKIGLSPNYFQQESTEKFHSLLKTEDKLRAENKELKHRIKEQETNANAFHELEMRLARVEGELMRCKSQLDVAVAEKGNAKRETKLIKAEFASYREETLAYYFERQKAHNFEMKALKSSILSIRVPEFYLHGVVPYHAISLNKKSCLSLGMPKVNNRKVQFSHFEAVGSTHTTEHYSDRHAIKDVALTRMGTYMVSVNRRFHGLFEAESEQWQQEEFQLDQLELSLFGGSPLSKDQHLEMYQNWHKMGHLTAEKMNEIETELAGIEARPDFDFLEFEVDYEGHSEFLEGVAEADLAVANALREQTQVAVTESVAVELEEPETVAQIEAQAELVQEASVFDNPTVDLGSRRRSRS
ncbi:hypothetical protein BCR33DRAFT_848153 [Rhizoclosmatium globosum]|uniref:Uncharacterized protein n=1 Tax=Rhizoclosmatium globosum TaxID=329046 RepID=A0A1Y2CM51_9FUNG|nr:hypothetical protein BCR33DRAFT_848153 [Rhizoclosmatium globosum]|eukprot:ORY48099.1 hypothetical protein BCR33DRAFT_848153 [Rhizoclosmatium globosum]